mmetsp:Transcript_103504/g.259476  ORF Transcript_103504/g.259476 Transcript_103504/m.259476 type:complete len:132 (+) Transcript_103504:728-1123(+)
MLSSSAEQVDGKLSKVCSGGYIALSWVWFARGGWLHVLAEALTQGAPLAEQTTVVLQPLFAEKWCSWTARTGVRLDASTNKAMAHPRVEKLLAALTEELGALIFAAGCMPGAEARVSTTLPSLPNVGKVGP